MTVLFIHVFNGYVLLIVWCVIILGSSGDPAVEQGMEIDNATALEVGMKETSVIGGPVDAFSQPGDEVVNKETNVDTRGPDVANCQPVDKVVEEMTTVDNEGPTKAFPQPADEQQVTPIKKIGNAGHQEEATPRTTTAAKRKKKKASINTMTPTEL